VLLVVMYLGAVALTTWALLDVAQTPPESVRTLAKGSWALLVVIPFVGPAAWFALGTRRRPARASRPIGPDDDPEFLRELGRRDRPE